MLAGECKVTIISDDAADKFTDKLMEAIENTSKQYKIGSSSYGQQFTSKGLGSGAVYPMTLLL